MAVWSSFLTAIRESFQRSSRTGPVQYVVLHHGATTSDAVMIQMMVSGSRQVSAQVVVKDGRRTGVVPEDLRAWTSASSYWDGRAMTIECANESTNGWTISDASYESLAILLADWSTRYGFPLIRNGRNSTVFGHSELYTWFGDSYATACPGGMDIDRVVRRANEIKAGGSVAPVPERKKDVARLRSTQNTEARPIAAGKTQRFLNNKAQPISLTGVGADLQNGRCDVKLHVYGKGAEGSEMDLYLIRVNIATGKESPHYVETIDTSGAFKRTVGYTVDLPKGFVLVAEMRVRDGAVQVDLTGSEALIFEVE